MDRPPLTNKRRCARALFMSATLSACFPAWALAADVMEVPAATVLLQQGIAAYNRADYAGAVNYLSRRARTAPEDANVYYYLGNCYVRLKKNDSAAKMYSAAVRVAPSSQAGQYSLKALVSLSSAPASQREAAQEDDGKPDAKAVEAARDALMSDAPVDKRYNDATSNVKNEREHFKGIVDRYYDRVQEDLLSLNRRSPTYNLDLERMRRQSEIDIQSMLTQELRRESRMMAPDKIDARAVPNLPEEKRDDAKSALGSLTDYLHPEKPFDPFAVEITPEQAAKFMSVRDVFGDLATYQPPARKLAKQLFRQLKATIEYKQDSFDRDVKRVKQTLLTDIMDIKTRYWNSPLQQLTPQYQLSQIKGPRTDQTCLSASQIEVSKATERAKKHLDELEQGYNQAVDIAVTGAKERLGSIVAAGSLDSQLKHPSGNIQIVPSGTDLYTRNYVNFGDHSQPPSSRKAK